MSIQLLNENFEFVMALGLALIYFILPNTKSKSSEENILSRLLLAIFLAWPKSYQTMLERNLNWSGLHGMSCKSNLVLGKLFFVLLSLFLLFFLPAYIVLAIVITSFFILDLVLISLVKRRQSEIAASLPQAIDLMLICVDAGLGLDAAIQKITADKTSLNSSLSEELNLLSKDILLGMEREVAYKELYTRTGVEELKSFSGALNQASKMGLSVAKILRSQAEFIRLKQSQKAEEKAAKLPIWMAFPLWFCIMPSIMLILLGPSLISFFNQISNFISR